MIELVCEHCGDSFQRKQRTGGRGTPKRFCSRRCRYAAMVGARHPNFIRGRYVPRVNDYVTVLRHGHPRAHRNRVKEHILVAERALGKPLPSGAEVHHHDGDRRRNAGANLVICESRRYHMLLEARTRRLRDLGRLDVRRCTRCKRVLPLAFFAASRRQWDGHHYECKECVNARGAEYRREVAR